MTVNIKVMVKGAAYFCSRHLSGRLSGRLSAKINDEMLFQGGTFLYTHTEGEKSINISVLNSLLV